MSPRSPRERFDQMSERARAAAGSRPGRDDPAWPIAPGDLFAFPETAGHGVEWVLLERWDVPPRALLVAADTRPQVGTGDVEVPAGEPAAPLVLRCRFDARVAPARLTREHRTGRVSEAVVAAAREARRAADSGTLAGSPTERETDADPEHQAWLDDVVRPARTALEAAGAAPAKAPPRGARPDRIWPSTRALYALAASLLVAVLGLSLYSVGLLEELERERLPRVDLQVDSIPIGDDPRGPEPIEVAAGRPLLLYLDLKGDARAFSTFRVTLVSDEDEPVWSSDPLEPEIQDELRVWIPDRYTQPGSRMVLQLYGLDDGERLLGTQELSIETP